MKLTGDHNRCPTCWAPFNSTKAFDKHRVGSYITGRRCLTPAEMEAKGMSVNTKGYWITAARTFG